MSLRAEVAEVASEETRRKGRAREGALTGSAETPAKSVSFGRRFKETPLGPATSL